MFLPHSFFQTMYKCSSSGAHRGKPLQLQIMDARALTCPAGTQGTGFIAELPKTVLSLFSTLNFEHNISVSGNPSQQVISSRQPVIYSKCLNEPSFLWSEVAVLADRCLHCFLLFNKICLCHKGFTNLSTFVLVYLETTK